jgi:hypothetical protein
MDIKGTVLCTVAKIAFAKFGLQIYVPKGIMQKGEEDQRVILHHVKFMYDRLKTEQIYYT